LPASRGCAPHSHQQAEGRRDCGNARFPRSGAGGRFPLESAVSLSFSPWGILLVNSG